MILGALNVPWLATLEICAGAEMPPVVAIVDGRAVVRAKLERRIAQSRSMTPERFDSMRSEEEIQATSRVLWVLVVQEIEYTRKRCARRSRWMTRRWKPSPRNNASP